MSGYSTRDKILDAASYIVQMNGILDLTLEATAKQAGISKGGLLHHFPSKEALIEGMVHYMMQKYMNNISSGAEDDPVATGKWTRSFINDTFFQSASRQNMDAGLMAAAAINPDLLKPIQDAYDFWQYHIERDDLDPTDATILRLAVDGLWFSEMFGLAPLDQQNRQKVLARLIQLTKR